MIKKSNRREFLSSILGATGLFLSSPIIKSENLNLERIFNAEQKKFKLNYLLATCLYGYMDLPSILPEVKKTGTTLIDIWPKVHGNQREQLDEMGEANFKSLLKKNKLKLGCITQFKLGPYGLAEEMELAARLGCKVIVTGIANTDGPKGLSGQELKIAVKGFVERMKPHLAKAGENGITIAIENHSGLLLDSFDAIKYFNEYSEPENLKLALAPSHLPQDKKELASLIRSLGNEGLALFYAWQFGNGFIGVTLPKDEEMMQLPGRGKLDFQPLIAALHNIDYQGLTEIFMHPTPRGIPIAETASLVTAEIIDVQKYLNGFC
jgi:sugar phosphate isomerase/epimerase